MMKLRIHGVFGDGGSAPSFASLPRRTHPESFLIGKILTKSYKKRIIQVTYITLYYFRNMGMRKKMRNKMKAQWKLDKIKRDKKKLKRVRKVAAEAASK